MHEDQWEMIESVMVYDADGSQTVEHYSAEGFLEWLDVEMKKQIVVEDLERYREGHGPALSARSEK